MDVLKVGMRIRRMCGECGTFATQTVTFLPDALKKGAAVTLDCNGGHEEFVPRYQLEAELEKGKADTL